MNIPDGYNLWDAVSDTTATAAKHSEAIRYCASKHGLSIDEYKLVAIFGEKGFKFSKQETCILFLRPEALTEKERKELSIPLGILCKKHGVTARWAEGSGFKSILELPRLKRED